MISPIKLISFTGNSASSARDAYSEKVNKNDATAQAQTGLVLASNDNSKVANQTGGQISLQGNGAAKKLNVIA